MPARATPKREQAFQVWYNDPRRGVGKTAIVVGVSERTIERWMLAHDWRGRAARMDAEARRLTDIANIQRQAEMLRRQAMQGRNLAQVGANFFAANPAGITEARDAINAIKIGHELERKAEGLPDWIVDLLGKSDDELRAEYNALAPTAIGDHQADADQPGNQPE